MAGLLGSDEETLSQEAIEGSSVAAPAQSPTTNTQLRPGFAPFSTVPNEVLAHILFMVDDYSVNAKSSRRHIAQVNNDWRQLTLALPSFWARMTLAFNYQDYPLEDTDVPFLLDSINSFQLHLARTQDRPLDITIALFGIGPRREDCAQREQTIDAMLEEIVLSAPRWSSLRLISAKANRFPHPILVLLEKHYPPSLTHLSLRCSSVPRRVVLGGAVPPSLVLDTNVAILADQRYWKIMRAAHLSAWPYMAPGGTLSVLKKATGLTELYLAGLNHGGHDEADTTLPSVRRLLWGRSNQSCWASRLYVPSLRTLELRGETLWPDLPHTLPRFRAPNRYGGPTLAKMIMEGRVGAPSNVYIDARRLHEDASAVAAGLHQGINTITFGYESCGPFRTFPVRSSTAVFPTLLSFSIPTAVENSEVLTWLETSWDARDTPLAPEDILNWDTKASHMWTSEASQNAINIVEATIHAILLWTPDYVTPEQTVLPTYTITNYPPPFHPFM